MKINIAFLIISKKEKNVPYLACINDGNKKFIPNFEFTNDSYPDLFEYARNRFKDITQLNAINLDGIGWSYLHMCGTLVKNNELYITYGTMIPNTLNVKDCEWINIIEAMEKDFFEENVFKQLTYCFNDISR